jgi:hypothetical protein
MAGVAGPMLRRDSAQGTRFLLGLLAGGLAASAAWAVMVYAAGTPLSHAVPVRYREYVAALVITGLGLADLVGRTPHTGRQVPQRFFHLFPPGRLGLVWGFDLSLLVTTQKTTSLTWAALTGLVLLVPSAAVPVLLTMTVIGILAVAARSLRKPSVIGDRGKPWFAQLRRAAGLALLVLAAVIAL